MSNALPSGPTPDAIVQYIQQTSPDTDVVEAMHAWFFSLDAEKHWPNFATLVTVSDIAPSQRAIDFIEAGGDMIVLGPIDVAVPMAQVVAERANGDAVLRARIDESALRILEAKDVAGLLPCSG
jgi:hypothetical protein